MEFKVKDIDVRVGDGLVVILNEHDAKCIGANAMDRIRITHGAKQCIAIVDIAESRHAIPIGSIGMFEEVLTCLKAKNNDKVKACLEPKPESVMFIKRKLDGHTLSYPEQLAIIKDIVNNKLTIIELATFVLANYTKAMSEQEILDLTKAMIATGHTLKFKGNVVDFHSIGGVPGNRTTPIVVAIVAATGLVFPKTSSRAITSPAGTADTMETICKVDLSYNELKKVVNKTNACIAWGGAVQLAPADDRIIKIESPLGIDAEGQMLASIMSKKASVGAKNLLLEIPVGKGAKANEEQAKHLKDQFENLGHNLGIRTLVVLTNGSQPIGNGIGPVLEMNDCLKVLRNENDAPIDLREKSILLSATLLELAGFTSKGNGRNIAEELLTSGKAFKKFEEIVTAQKGKIPTKLNPGKFQYTIKSPKSGLVWSINNLIISRVARIAGSPLDKTAGIQLHTHMDNIVRKNQPLLTIHSSSKDKLKFAIEGSKNIIEIR